VRFVAHTALFAIEWIAARLSFNPPGHRLPPVPAPFRWVPVLARLLKVARRAPPPAFKRHFVGCSFSRRFGDDSGYVEALPDGERRILPGHTFATIQFVLTFALFWLALYAKSLPGGSCLLQAVPDRDRYGVPRSDSDVHRAAVAAERLVAGRRGLLLRQIPHAAFHYRAGCRHDDRCVVVHGLCGADSRPRLATYQLATPGQVLKAFGDRPLVVAAAGGGIQAGAWTTRVLRGLDDSLHGTLRRRVALISSVSGGSMGALYYGAFENAPSLDGALEQALKPSLDEVATSFISRDIFGVIGLRLAPDRGAALEDTWERRLPGGPGASPTLRSWSEAAHDFAFGAGRSNPFPAFLFNSTVVESGQPIVFATTQFPTHPLQKADWRTNRHLSHR